MAMVRMYIANSKNLIIASYILQYIAVASHCLLHIIQSLNSIAENL